MGVFGHRGEDEEEDENALLIKISVKLFIVDGETLVKLLPSHLTSYFSTNYVVV